MKKIGIVTIISKNYGNRLQNYALQEYLSKFGLEVQTIPLEKQSVVKRKMRILIKSCLSYVKDKYKNVRWDTFDERIHWHPYPVQSQLFDSGVFNCFIAGSDQIWNPLFSCNSEREFLTFAQGSKRIAYAASIGLDELPEQYRIAYRDYIASFRMVSVRENSAADIIEDLGCVRPEIVLDPTMLLSAPEWAKVADSGEFKEQGKYVVKYFLGIRNGDYDSYIEQTAEKIDAEVIDITDPDINCEIGPSEFVYLIKNASEVFTDSFHGTIFSILFHKPFVVFERPYEAGYGTMSSRLDTLLRTFELEDHRVFNADMCSAISREVNYQTVDDILVSKRRKASDFLMKAIEIDQA